VSENPFTAPVMSSLPQADLGSGLNDLHGGSSDGDVVKEGPPAEHLGYQVVPAGGRLREVVRLDRQLDVPQAPAGVHVRDGRLLASCFVPQRDAKLAGPGRDLQKAVAALNQLCEVDLVLDDSAARDGEDKGELIQARRSRRRRNAGRRSGTPRGENRLHHEAHPARDVRSCRLGWLARCSRG
jgi:hypothetical protein